MAMQLVSIVMCAFFATMVSGWNCQLKEHHLCAQISNYIVLIDAGSTGSRIFVYNYPPRMLDASELPYIVKSPLTLPTLVGSYSKRPGLSSFYANPDDVATYLHDLVMHAKALMLQHDPTASVSHVPLYLSATAGMRQLAQHRSNHLMSHVRDYFMSDDCPFDFSRKEQARVISGEEEGVFGWLANNNKHGSLSASPETTFGLLDMGGASAQIAFIPKEASILADFFAVHIGQFTDGPIHLYTHSFQGFGYVLAFQRVCKLLLSKSDGTKFANPCLSRGLTWNVTSPDFGVSTAKANIDVVTADGPIQMIGTGDFAQCRELAQSLLRKEECFLEPCSLLGVYQPELKGSDFIAVGEYSTAFSLSQAALSKHAMLDAMHEGGIEYCKLSDDEQKKLNTKGKPITCWIAVWTYTFLTDGLGFDASHSLKHLSVEADWTWGQAIYEINRFPYRLFQSVKDVKVRGTSPSNDVTWMTSPQLILTILTAAVTSALLSVMATRIPCSMCKGSKYTLAPQSLRKNLLDV